jgi:hypothetical protein
VVADDGVPRWRRVVEDAREEMRRAAARGDRRALRELANAGAAPPVPHWSDVEGTKEGG